MKNEIFKANPSLDVYYESADGTAFFTEDAARNHARGLEDKTVSAVYNKKGSNKSVNEIEVTAELVESTAKVGQTEQVNEVTAKVVESTAKVEKTEQVAEDEEIVKAPLKVVKEKPITTKK